MTNVECFICLPNGQEASFWIQPECKLARLKSNTLDQLGYNITDVFVTNRMKTKPARKLCGDNLFLIEDHLIKTDDLIILRGHKVKDGGGLPNAVNLNAKIVYLTSPNALVSAPEGFIEKVNIRQDAQLCKMLLVFRKDHDFIPETVEFWNEDGTAKLNLTHTASQAGLKEGSTFQVRGQYFPLSILGPRYEFASTRGLFFESDCIVCTEPLATIHVWENCGHRNVCPSCGSKLKACPTCRKPEPNAIQNN
jgi:hypothetical protein